MPSQRTLRDYTHYIAARVGFSHEVDKHLMDMVDFSKEKTLYVGPILDEVRLAKMKVD